jgi:hypothetical protein
MLSLGAQQLAEQLHKSCHRRICHSVSDPATMLDFANKFLSQQPWCTYALHIATFTSLSVLFDPLILILTFRAFRDLPNNGQFYCLYAQLAFMFWTKVIKLVGLFVREPTDIAFLPLSILFGYFHGLIKLWALATLRMVCHVLIPECPL